MLVQVIKSCFNISNKLTGLDPYLRNAIKLPKNLESRRNLRNVPRTPRSNPSFPARSAATTRTTAFPRAPADRQNSRRSSRVKVGEEEGRERGKNRAREIEWGVVGILPETDPTGDAPHRGRTPPETHPTGKQGGTGGSPIGCALPRWESHRVRGTGGSPTGCALPRWESHRVRGTGGSPTGCALPRWGPHRVRAAPMGLPLGARHRWESHRVRGTGGSPTGCVLPRWGSHRWESHRVRAAPVGPPPVASGPGGASTGCARPRWGSHRVFRGQSKVRLLPLGRLRSWKTKNPSLHPLKKKATTAVSRSRRRRFLRRVHVKASRRPLCRFIRYAFLFILPFQGSQPSV
ncbi:hypothetical protein Taro_008606 [Colocasia esculenta]|uniref:Uncharacterized protein n=1 Tax=Colocasia esculenta TaxID=4460 RepID=A0A843U2S1_COLES|nr:hypothetical protein [Colocasia esculenta]